MIRALILTLFLLNITSLNAQSHLFVKAGTAYSNVFRFNGLDVNSSAYGVQMGFQYHHSIQNNFNLKAELLYSGQFPNSSTKTEQRTKLKLHYFSLPLLAYYKFYKFDIELGPELYYMLNMPATSEVFNYGGAIGFSYNPLDQISLNLRYSLGLKWISHTFISDDGDQIHHSNFLISCLQLSLAYRLF